MDPKTKKKIIIGVSLTTILGVGGYFLYKYLKNKGVHHFTFVKPWRSYSSHPKSKVYREFAKQKGFIIETNYLDVKDFLSMLKYYIRYFLIFNIYKLINL